jgi:biopolymer transport protein ExbB
LIGFDWKSPTKQIESRPRFKKREKHRDRLMKLVRMLQKSTISLTSITSNIGSKSAALILAGAVALASFGAIGTATAQSTTPATPPAATAPAAPTAEVKAPEAGAVKAPTGGAKAAAENPYGLMAMLKEGGIVSWITFSILVIMSAGSWYITFTKLLEQRRLNSEGDAAKKSFWSAGSVRQGADTLKSDSAYRFIADKGLEATKKHDGLLGQVDLNTFVTQGIERAINNVQSRSQDGLAFLATVGATAPFVGLFGTVWGILQALVKIGQDGQASIDKVAGPVGEALIMTAIGLAVAVPAVLGYNWLVRRNKAALDNVREFGSDLHSVLLANQTKR